VVDAYRAAGRRRSAVLLPQHGAVVDERFWVGVIAAESLYRSVQAGSDFGSAAVAAHSVGNSTTPSRVVAYFRAAVGREITAVLALANQTGGGSIRSIVLMRSMDRSKEATLLIPVLSAHATRYASAKSIRSVS
jgi:hypothetical protein